MPKDCEGAPKQKPNSPVRNTDIKFDVRVCIIERSINAKGILLYIEPLQNGNGETDNKIASTIAKELSVLRFEEIKQKTIFTQSDQFPGLLENLQLVTITQQNQNGSHSANIPLNGNGNKFDKIKFVSDFISSCNNQYILLVLKRILTIQIRNVLIEDANEKRENFFEKNYELRDKNWYETWNEKLKDGGRKKRYKNLGKVFSKVFDDNLANQLIQLLNKTV